MWATILFLLVSSPSSSTVPTLPAVAPEPREGKPKAVSDTLEGIWAIESLESADFRFAGDNVKNKFLIFIGTQTVNTSGNPTLIGTYTIDSTTTPKRLLIKGKNGPDEGKDNFFIYELDGDTLRICLLAGADGYREYPKQFPEKPTKGVIVVTSKRVKP